MGNYVAFLRGINVGGHHKVPMAELRIAFEKMGCTKVTTILNSGNVLFESDQVLSDSEISKRLESIFGFPIPTQTREFSALKKFHSEDPFKEIEITKDTRLYISFLPEERQADLTIPWTNEDGSFQILKKEGRNIFSTLDLSLSKTPKAMEVLEKSYGNDITTRNWNTIGRILKKAESLGWH